MAEAPDDDKPTVAELIEFYELLIKGKLLLLLNAKAREEIEEAKDFNEASKVIKRVCQEDPTLLHRLRKAIGKGGESLGFIIDFCGVGYNILL